MFTNVGWTFIIIVLKRIIILEEGDTCLIIMMIVQRLKVIVGLSIITYICTLKTRQKAIKPQSQIYVFTTSCLYCYIAAKILICCRWWSSHKCLNDWIYLRWSLIKQLRSSTVHNQIIKYCYFSLPSFYCLWRE